MALGDGSTWDESNPQQSTLANQIDSYQRDEKIGVRVRMAQEHIWPSSQTASAQAGQHVYISFQAQTATPSPVVVNSVTQLGILFGSAGNLQFVNSAGTVTTVVASAGGLYIANANYSNTGTYGDVLIGSAASGLVQVLKGGTSAQYSVLVSNSNTADASFLAANSFANQLGVDVGDYGTSASTNTAKNFGSLKIRYGQITISGSSSQALSNLPFTSASSYRLIVCPYDASGAYNEGPSVTQQSGSGATIYNNHSDSRTFNWIAIGI